MTAADEIRDRLKDCEAALARAKHGYERIGSRTNPDVAKEMLIEMRRLEERRSTLTECLMLVERE